jgi:hypothetical protein
MIAAGRERRDGRDEQQDSGEATDHGTDCARRRDGSNGTPDRTHAGRDNMPARTGHMRAWSSTSRYAWRMCRSIRPLRVVDPPTTDGDVHAAALQYVRKVSGSRTPPRRGAGAFEAAIADVAAATTRLLEALGTPPVAGDATPPALWSRTGSLRARSRRDEPAAAPTPHPGP